MAQSDIKKYGVKPQMPDQTFPSAWKLLLQDGFSEQVLHRVKGESGAPPPINCLLSHWSEWGSCNPCGKESYRSRSVLKYGQFRGKPCFEPLGDKQSCVTDQVCPEEEIDCGEEEDNFQCANGVCIKQRLVCNTDNDCGDFSDEANCNDTKSRPPCRGRIVGISKIGRKAGQGLNILGMRPKGTPFYNEFYNGFCNRERDRNTGIYYRTPWNVAVINYRTNEDRRFSSGEYSDKVAAMRKMFTEGKQDFQSSLSLKFIPTETQTSTSIELSPGLSASTNTNISRFLEVSSEREQTFLYLKGTIEVGTYIMRNRDVRLTDTFLEDLKNLPSNYDMGEYFRFLETYGTHYTEKGKVGGIYELLYVLDKRNMREEGVTVENVKACLGYDDMVRFAMQMNNSTGRAIIHSVIARVQGGMSVILAELEEKLSRGAKLVNAKDFIRWAATLTKAPALIDYIPHPIYTLVPVKMPNAHTKKQNLEQAVEDYVAEYNVCKCQPCPNGGTVILVNGECICACSPYFKGMACQIPKYEQITAQTFTDGGWSCWSSWSPCVQGERTRTRECNNPAPKSRGRHCEGAALERRRCT
ncbi:PREDICTED: complement component C9 [Gekko japonicus]|uniref:Complement component C9 n=1 Tax=Gekko japonicus TaxID=146911 RepID=A0ABM1KPK5_GEKJA|nr:PREDICTED: complement component C9 [Gekko japonicus]